MSHVYGDGTNSTVGTQFNLFKYNKKAVIEATKKQYFGQMSGVLNQPKHFGKTVKKYHYIPVLDDRNVNDQGIDAAGTVLVAGTWSAWDVSGVLLGSSYVDEAAAIAAVGSVVQAENGGNLYGSSKDVGTITAKMPALSEEGGRVNRVGNTRLELEGTIENFGFFEEFTRDSMNFDTDDMLMTHLYREAGRAAGEMNEDKLMIDLYNAAGIEIYSGGTTTLVSVDLPCSYDDLQLMDKTLTQNYAKMDTQIITGSRNIDTATISGARFAHCSIESRQSLENMKDNFGARAWTPARMYAAGGTLATGEMGAIDTTRFIQVPEMIQEDGAGAAGVDVHPILFVGGGSFTQIGFQSNGKNIKLEVITKMPSKETADRTDPYGKVGFYSSQWWSGVLIERADHIGKILHDPSAAHPA